MDIWAVHHLETSIGFLFCSRSVHLLSALLEECIPRVQGRSDEWWLSILMMSLKGSLKWRRRLTWCHCHLRLIDGVYEYWISKTIWEKKLTYVLRLQNFLCQITLLQWFQTLKCLNKTPFYNSFKLFYRKVNIGQP